MSGLRADDTKPLVVLIGDSIRMGYQFTVAAELANEAEVWGPDDNCQHTAYGLERLPEWFKGRGDAAVVVVNFGLHDCYLPDSQNTRHTVEQYKANLEAIFSWLATHTHAQVLFANTTPVSEERQIRSDVYRRLVRRQTDVDRFNAAAMEIVHHRGITVVDLHRDIMTGGLDRLGKYDGVHFTREGFKVLGRSVAAAIRTTLAKKTPSSVAPPK